MVSLPPATLRTAADLSTAAKGRRAARRLGDRVGSRLLGSSHGPVNVHALASEEGIEVVQAAALAESGRIEWTRGNLRIALSRKEGLPRQRFTLAHELGHHLIFGIEREGARTYSQEEETRCDKFAAALLMPEATFKSSLRRHRNLSRLSAVRELADEFGVSLQAAMIRLDDLSLIDTDSILLMCEVDAHGNYRVRSGAYDRSTYRQLEQLTTQSLGIKDVHAPERSMRMKLPTRQGGLPQGSQSYRHAIVTCVPLRSDQRQVLVEVENGTPLAAATNPNANACSSGRSP